MAATGGKYGGGGAAGSDGAPGIIRITYNPINALVGVGLIGALVCAGSVTSVNPAVGTGAVGHLAASGTAAAVNPAVGGGAIGPVSASGALTSTNALSGAGVAGPVEASGTLTPAGLNPLSGAGIVGPVSASGELGQFNALTGAGFVGPVQAAGTITIAGTNALSGSVSVGTVAASGALAALNPMTGSGAVGSLLASGAVSTWNVLAGDGTVPVAAAGTLAALNPLTGSGAVGALVASGRIQVIGATLPVDDNYVVALPARVFYAALQARDFYVLDTPFMTDSFDPKDPRETVVLTFDASAGLASGETLTLIDEVDVTMASGTDAHAADVVTNPQINGASITIAGKSLPTGTAVQAEAVGGVSPARYLIAVTCKTSNSDKVLTLKGILPVSAS